MSQTKKKLSQVDLLPFSEGESVALIALERIDTTAQVRTVFDDESLAELASDIAARGVMQPITVRQVEEGRFLIVAGERRFRAAGIAGLSVVPALIRNVTDAEAEDMQLAENIQREELSLQDTAAGIRKLFDRERSLGKVAALVNKSKPWVCKHLSLTMPDMSEFSKSLMRDGVTEDMEILNLVSKVSREFGSYEAFEMAKAVRKGEMNRTKAREYIKNLRAARDAAEENATSGEDEEGDDVKYEPIFNIYLAKGRVNDAIGTAREQCLEPDAEAIAALFSYEEQTKITSTVVGSWESGKLIATISDERMKARAILLAGYEAIDQFNDSAFLVGVSGEENSVTNLVREYIELSRE